MEQTATGYYQSALKKFRRGELAEGIADLDRAIDLDPFNMVYVLDRGDWKYRLEDYPSAIQDFDRVISTSQDRDDLREAHTKHAICLNALIGSTAELLPDLDWLISAGFGTGNNYCWRGAIKLEMGQAEEAIDDFTQAYTLEPDAEDFLLKRAHAYYAAHRFDEAVRDLTEILNAYENLHPGYLAVVHRWRAKAYHKAGLDQAALDDLNRELQFEGHEMVPTLAEYMARYGLDD